MEAKIIYSNYAINHYRGGISEGGFKNIFLSKGWFYIRCHLFIRICLRSGIDGRNSATNGKMLLRVFCLFCRADIPWLKLISVRVMFKTLSL